MLGEKVVYINKSANRAISKNDPYGNTWIEKDLTKANAIYAAWPLQLNEILAYELAKEIDLNIPDLNVEGELVSSLYSGIDLYNIKARKLIKKTLLKSSGIEQLSKLFVFSHWIGDYDRTIHHTLIRDDMTIWFIDFEFCGLRPTPDLYPEKEPGFKDFEHISCINNLKHSKPVSKKIKKHFPEVIFKPDDYPWNSSLILWLMKEGFYEVVPKLDFKNAALDIAKIDAQRLRNHCDTIFKDEIIAGRLYKFLTDRKLQLAKTMEAWKTKLILNYESNFITTY